MARQADGTGRGLAGRAGGGKAVVFFPTAAAAAAATAAACVPRDNAAAVLRHCSFQPQHLQPQLALERHEALNLPFV